MQLAALVAGLCVPATLNSGPQAAKSTDPSALPARDSHQGLLVAADPYLSSERSQQAFGKKHPYGVGLLALEVYLRNDTGGPMQVGLETMELNVAPPGQQRQRLAPLTAEEAAYKIVLPEGPNPKQRRGPIPGMSGVSGKSKEVAKMEDALRAQMLPGDMLGPHRTVHGFVFFDVDGHFDRVGSATLYVPDVKRIDSGEKLFFFEVNLGPATR
jgi:hypothetical protein